MPIGFQLAFGLGIGQLRRATRGRSGLHVGPDRREVEIPGAQGTREGSAPFGEFETLLVEVQPGTPPREGAALVDDGDGAFAVPAPDQDHPFQFGPRAASPAPHARAFRATTRPFGNFGSAGPWPSREESTPRAHEVGPGDAGAAPSSSDRMSIRHPVNLAARRAFCPSLPIASESW